jgi:hypothetical protein
MDGQNRAAYRQHVLNEHLRMVGVSSRFVGRAVVRKNSMLCDFSTEIFR